LERERFKYGRDYTQYLPFGYATYSPWFEDWFQKIYLQVKQQTIVTEDRCYIIYRLSQHCSQIQGDFAECGVYKGGTAYIIAYALEKKLVQNKRLHLFDTFSGLPRIADSDPSGLKSGQFGDVSLGAVRDFLHSFGFIDFHPGVIPETFADVQEAKFAFAHVDIDLYGSAKDCCGFFYERLTPGGVLIFDNYGFQPYRGAEKRAVDEFFKDKPETLISLPTGQCIVLKL
jgi:O-methyltransferase